MFSCSLILFLFYCAHTHYEKKLLSFKIFSNIFIFCFLFFLIVRKEHETQENIIIVIITYRPPSIGGTITGAHIAHMQASPFNSQMASCWKRCAVVSKMANPSLCLCIKIVNQVGCFHCLLIPSSKGLHVIIISSSSSSIICIPLCPLKQKTVKVLIIIGIKVSIIIIIICYLLMLGTSGGKVQLIVQPGGNESNPLYFILFQSSNPHNCFSRYISARCLIIEKLVAGVLACKPSSERQM